MALSVLIPVMAVTYAATAIVTPLSFSEAKANTNLLAAKTPLLLAHRFPSILFTRGDVSRGSRALNPENTIAAHTMAIGTI